MAPTRDGAAVLAVLTQRLLLSLIASFQRGPQGVVVPLVKRLVADGFVRCAVRIHRVGWFDWRESRRITTLLCKDVRPQRAWADRAVPEAIAQYDAENLHALRTLVATTAAFATVPERAVPQLLHRVAEAAAAFGRVDILSWLHSQHDVFTTQPLLLSFCVKHATRHGQITVLEWMEQTFSSHALEILRDYVLHALVQQRDSKMVQWLCAHKLGVVPPRSLRFAAERGDVDTLRVLLEDVVVHAPHREALVALAVRADQADVVAYLVGDRAFPFTTTTLDKAIAQRQLAVAKCLLDHRESLRRSERATLVSSSLVQQLIASNDLAMLSMLASVKNATVLGCTVMTCCHFSRPSDAAVRVLLPLSSVEDATVTLLRFAVRKQASIVDTILAGTRAPLPAVAVAFVTRIANDSLGPLATRAMEFYESRESGLMDEIVASVSKASREDVVDTVLRFLPGPAFSLTSILKADAKRPGGAACDEPFLQLCLSLRQSERDSHHRAIQQYLHTRKKPRAATSIK